MNLAQRSLKKELLDQEGIPFDDIRLNLQELNLINKYLGGHKISIMGVREFLRGTNEVSICEIGCGGGDNLLAIHDWCKEKKISVRLTGIDIMQSCIDFAKTKTAIRHCTEWIANDYRNVEFKEKPDILFSSLFCHHFSSTDLITQMKWMQNNCAQGFFINDLHRHWMAYYSIRLISRAFSKSYLLKNDAPLSVARGFRRHEWENILQQSGIEKFKINWKWAFRHLIIVKK